MTPRSRHANKGPCGQSESCGGTRGRSERLGERKQETYRVHDVFFVCKDSPRQDQIVIAILLNPLKKYF